jgi:hypothetical protein
MHRFTHGGGRLESRKKSLRAKKCGTGFPPSRTTVRGKLATYQTSTIVTPLKNGVHLEISEN